MLALPMPLSMQSTINAVNFILFRDPVFSDADSDWFELQENNKRKNVCFLKETCFLLKEMSHVDFGRPRIEFVSYTNEASESNLQ